MFRVYWYEDLVEKWERLLYPTKPTTATFEEWDNYKEYKKDYPIRYWFAETLPDIISKVFWPFEQLYEIKWWLAHRYDPEYRYFMIDTKLKPGYHEVDTRMLHGMFGLLVDYVESTCAWKERIGEPGSPAQFESRGFKDRERGLKYLAWEKSLDDPDLTEYDASPAQAAGAREIEELYLWWTDVRPNRPDAMDVSGWSAYCDRMWEEDRNFTTRSEEEQKESYKMIQESNRIEKKYFDEDTKMLTRLIKIRSHLWS